MRARNGVSKATVVGISYLDVGMQKTLEEVIINNCRWTAVGYKDVFVYTNVFGYTDASRGYTDVFVPSTQIFST